MVKNKVISIENIRHSEKFSNLKYLLLRLKMVIFFQLNRIRKVNLKDKILSLKEKKSSNF